MKSPIICLVTDGRGDVAAALRRIRAAATAGVNLVQIRERQLADRALVDFVRQARAATRGTSARIVVNDRLDVSLGANADGIHLRGDSFSARRVRAAVGEPFLVGRSVHDLDEALAAEREGGCDYLLFGTVFRSSSKPDGHPIAGLNALRAVCAGVKLPVVAIGGISRGGVAAVAAAGASGVAAISLFDDAESIRSTVESLRRSFDT